MICFLAVILHFYHSYFWCLRCSWAMVFYKKWWVFWRNISQASFSYSINNNYRNFYYNNSQVMAIHNLINGLSYWPHCTHFILWFLPYCSIIHPFLLSLKSLEFVVLGNYWCWTTGNTSFLWRTMVKFKIGNRDGNEYNWR